MTLARRACSTAVLASWSDWVALLSTSVIVAASSSPACAASLTRAVVSSATTMAVDVCAFDWAGCATKRVGISVKNGRGVVQDTDRLGHLMFEGLQRPLDEFDAVVGRAQFVAALVENDTEPGCHLLRSLTLGLRLLE